MWNLTASRWLLRRACGRSRPGPVILLYHRVADLPQDPQCLAVTPENFDRQMALLRTLAQPVPLTELATGLRKRNVPPRAIAVTFDDGYEDNLLHALPILRRYGIPATVFVTADRVGSQEEFWPDELERILLLPGELPKRLDLRAGGVKAAWNLGEWHCYRPAQWDSHRGWNVLHKTDPTPRHRVYRTLAERIKRLDLDARTLLLDALRSLAQCGRQGRATHRGLGPGQLRELSSDPLVSIGGHTVNHPRLSSVCRREQSAQILEGKAILEKAIGRPVTSFSYPFGRPWDYSLHSLRVVREAGFVCACSNFADSVGPWCDPYQLPRVLIRDGPAEGFAARIESFLTGVSAR